MAPPPVSTESKRQRERERGRKRRERLRQHSQVQQLQEADSREIVRLVSQTRHEGVEELRMEADISNS